jgi:hypothetical protein
MEIQKIKSLLNMSSEEAESYLKDRMAEKFDYNKKATYNHKNYLEPSNNDHIINDSSGKKVTINGAKFMDDIREEDQLFTAGEIKDIIERD